MRGFWTVIMLALAGCAARVTAPQITAEEHAANVAAAEKAGYKVVIRGDRTLFCPTAAPTGSHMGPTCITERDFEGLMGTRHSTVPAATLQHELPGPGAGH